MCTRVHARSRTHARIGMHAHMHGEFACTHARRENWPQINARLRHTKALHVTTGAPGMGYVSESWTLSVKKDTYAKFSATRPFAGNWLSSTEGIDTQEHFTAFIFVSEEYSTQIPVKMLLLAENVARFFTVHLLIQFLLIRQSNSEDSLWGEFRGVNTTTVHISSECQDNFMLIPLPKAFATPNLVNVGRLDKLFFGWNFFARVLFVLKVFVINSSILFFSLLERLLHWWRMEVFKRFSRLFKRHTDSRDWARISFGNERNFTLYRHQL